MRGLFCFRTIQSEGDSVRPASHNRVRSIDMQYAEAFDKLGYRLDVPRQDWSAEKLDGVCISIWKKEMGSRDGSLWMDTRTHADPADQWQSKSGNKKRIRHLRRAIDD